MAMAECSTKKVVVVIDVQEAQDSRFAGQVTIGLQLDCDSAVAG
jgi:hypothetical protein